jgi:hypothetical protein
MIVMCNGMPRSGSTMQYNMARILLLATGRATAHGFTASQQSHTHGVSDEQMRAWGAEDHFHVVKMHEAHLLLTDLARANEMRVCYIYRDLRDVAASSKRAFGQRGGGLLRAVAEAHKHYVDLSAARAEAPASFLWQRYEDVRADLKSAVAEVAVFLDLALDDEGLEAAADLCSVERAAAACDEVRGHLDKHVAELREEDPAAAARYVQELRRPGAAATQVWLEGTWLLHHNHVSRDKGAPGAWRAALTPDEAAAITDGYGDWLTTHGYEV